MKISAILPIYNFIVAELGFYRYIKQSKQNKLLPDMYPKQLQNLNFLNFLNFRPLNFLCLYFLECLCFL